MPPGWMPGAVAPSGTPLCMPLHFDVKLRHSIRAVSGTPLSSSGLEGALLKYPEWMNERPSGWHVVYDSFLLVPTVSMCSDYWSVLFSGSNSTSRISEQLPKWISKWLSEQTSKWSSESISEWTAEGSQEQTLQGIFSGISSSGTYYKVKKPLPTRGSEGA